MNSSCTPVFSTTHPITRYIIPLSGGQTGAKAAFDPRQWQSVSAFSSFPFPSCSPNSPSSNTHTLTHTHTQTHTFRLRRCKCRHNPHEPRDRPFALRSPQKGQPKPSPRPQHANSFTEQAQVQEKRLPDDLDWGALRSLFRDGQAHHLKGLGQPWYFKKKKDIRTQCLCGRHVIGLASMCVSVSKREKKGAWINYWNVPTAHAQE